MNISGWKYYNHAALPACAPHETPDLTPIKNGDIWKLNGKRPLLARWTTDWDCGYDTGWWYVIKDTPFDISAINRKRRYEINKGMKNFDVKIISPAQYLEELFEVQVAAFSAYPAKYRPTVDKDNFVKEMLGWSKLTSTGNVLFYSAFSKENGLLAAYSFLIKKGCCLDFAVQKANPEYEHLNVNAALICGMLENCKDSLENGSYICDGSRSISHETQFQDYLEKNFGFRKAYCRIHIAYPRMMRLIMNFFSPFCRLIDCLGSKIRFLHLFASLLKMNNLAKKSSKEGAIK